MENKKSVLKNDKFNLIKTKNIEINIGQINNPLSYNDIKDIIDLNDIKFVYLNKNYVHNILYNEEKNIEIKYNENNINLCFIFYLYLLIVDDNTITYYNYSIDYIRKIYNNNMNNMNQNNNYKLIMISKIIIELINNYKGSNDEIQKEEKELKEIEENSKEKIQNNLKDIIKLEMYDEKYIIKKNIDKIYIDIIKSLIIEKKFENYEYICDIINQLELENINITKIMFNELKQLLNSKNNDLSDYIILEEKDLYDGKKINFHYILLKYILKDSIYINQIPILLKARQLFLKSLKSKKILYNNINNDMKDRFNFILEKIIDLKYYFKEVNKPVVIIKEIQNIGGKCIINNKNDSDSESSKKETQESNKVESLSEFPYFDGESIQNKKEHENNPFYNSSENLILDSNLSKIYIKYQDDKFLLNFNYIIKIKKDNKNILNSGISSFINNEESINSGNNINYNKDFNFQEFKKQIQYKFKESNSCNDNLEKNFIKIFDFIDNREKYLKNEFENKIEFEIQLQFLEIIIDEIKNEYKNINCQYVVINGLGNSNDIKNKDFVDKDILNNGKDDGFNKFVDFLKKKIISTPISSIGIISSNSSKTGGVMNAIHSIEEASSDEIIKFNDIIGQHNESANFIKELSNGLVVSGGDNNLFFYNYLTFTKIKNNECEIKNIKRIIERKINKGEIQLVVCSTEISYILTLKHNNKFERKMMDYEIEMKLYFRTITNDCIIANEKGIIQKSDLFNKITQMKKYEIIDKNFVGGIQISDNIFAFTSNKTLSNGEDKIIIYNSLSKKYTYIDNYSFVLSQNNLCLISKENENNNKFLLCACKDESQKNGILLVKIEINNYNSLSSRFFDTKDFEVYCFCQICKFENPNITNMILREDHDKNKMIGTEYFLIGGFDSINKQGLIKLYKINYNNDNLELIKIEYIQDIENKQNIIFKGAINCIIQSNYNGHILLTCSDGNVYKFSSPNIQKF